MKKDVLEKIDYYDENIRAYHDWDSRIRMTKKAKVGYSNYIGSAYVDDPAGISKTEKRQRLIQEMIQVIIKNKHLIGPDKKLLKDVKKLKGNLQFKLILLKPYFQRFLNYIIHALSTKGGLRRVLSHKKHKFIDILKNHRLF